MKEFDEYQKYTGPAQLSKTLNILEGMLLGIDLDGEICPEEIQRLAEWTNAHRSLSDRHPFSELIPILVDALADGTISPEEHADLLWLCQRLGSEHDYYSGVTASMQRLQGILAGILADGQVTVAELDALKGWLLSHEELRTVWPYTEVDSVVTSVMADGVIDEVEQQQLMALFTEFSGLRQRPARAAEDSEPPLITGICACDPEVKISGKVFYLTGESERCTKEEFAKIIQNSGGKWHPSVTKKVDYLVVGAGGNPCWAYSCYGRRIEKAVKMRKQGHKIMIIHEYDAWDAIEEIGGI